MQFTQQPKLSKQSLKLNYRAINISLHTSNQIWAQPMVPTVHRHHTHSIKHDGHGQIISLNAFINLFGHQGEIRKIYQNCTINSDKIIVAYLCSKKSTAQISCHLYKYSHFYKNDKLHRLILAKIVQSSEKCQTIDLIFFLHASQYHNTM